MGIPMQQAHAAGVKHIHVACAWEYYYVLLVLADLQIVYNTTDTIHVYNIYANTSICLCSPYSNTKYTNMF